MRTVVIDPFDEGTLPLAEMAKLLPNRPTPQCLWRWITKGRNGVRLQAIPVGRGYHTNKEAVTVFLNAVGDVKPDQIAHRKLKPKGKRSAKKSAKVIETR
ncbi:hypothetical protein CA54_40760 [Symmachiella macrocystis]|uniref:DUF1580 domain-containing protein n=1 Tax=Symmachiella macrocystis TaxID=2527985 RepID=A0A5C6BC29_9PLAN|nr:DUF1580 domain-containing protein [Symmachiella macrocystis]TWU08839.1 hypothetical protein CA54_40760 [Symmachiella macrocystis]